MSTSCQPHSSENTPSQSNCPLAVTFTRRYCILILWIIGWTIAIFGEGYTIDPQTEIELNAALDKADLIEQTHVDEAEINMDDAYSTYYESKGWWFCNRNGCPEKYKDYLKAHQQLKNAKALHDAAISEARSIAGIFSDYAVDDARRLFWSSWEWSQDQKKDLANDADQVATVAYYNTANSETITESVVVSVFAYFFAFLIAILTDIMLGFLSALISFEWQLLFFVASFNSGILAKLSFFWVASVAACSVTGSVILSPVAFFYLLRFIYQNADRDCEENCHLIDLNQYLEESNTEVCVIKDK